MGLGLTDMRSQESEEMNKGWKASVGSIYIIRSKVEDR